METIQNQNCEEVHQVKNHRGLVVLRDSIDYNNQSFWLLDMTPDEFESWWQSQESFWWPTDDIDFVLARQFGEPPPKVLPPMQLPGVFLEAEKGEAAKLWETLLDSHQHYYCKLCCNSDSVLVAPDGRRIRHKGYV